MRTITLTRGKSALVDDDDYEILKAHKWYCDSRGYAGRHEYTSGRERSEYMHRVIMRATADLHVDHINGNRLDNQRANLRFATRAQQARNTAKWKSGTTSRFKGVYWRKNRSRWVASIQENGKQKELGNFKDEVAAAVAYDTRARELFGEFARTNFVEAA